MREKELKFLEIFGEIDDVLILEAAAEPQRETFAGRTIQSAQRETFDGGTIQSAQRETSGGRQPVQRETFAGHTMQHKTKEILPGGRHVRSWLCFWDCPVCFIMKCGQQSGIFRL